MATNNIQSFGGDIDIGSNLTVNTTTLHVDSVSGRVGIGKTNPGYTLDVNTSVHGTAIYKSGTPLSGGGGSSPWSLSGTNVYYTAGNVGIGTINPQKDLEIFDGSLRLSNVSDSSNIEIHSRQIEWFPQQKIQASDKQSNDYFGYSVSISSDGNTAIVGAYLEDTGGTDTGSAYIFTRSGTTWSQEGQLFASDAEATDYFGYSVSISGDGNTAIVGAYLEDTGGTDTGSAYIFTRSGTTWSEQQKIQASDKQVSDRFGNSVSISSDGNTAIVGAYLEDTGGNGAGSAYIFTRSGTTWSQEGQLFASDAEASDYFGYSVSISSDGNTAIVGAYLEDTGGTDTGSAYIFTRSGTTWSEQQKIQASDKQVSDRFGNSVSISSDGNTAIVGAYLEDTGGNGAGSAYIFTRSGTTWSQEGQLFASDAEASDYFGYSVSISSDGNTAIVGAYREDTGGLDTGSAYIFTRSGTTWSEQTKINVPNSTVSDYFGNSVSISSDGNTAIVGAYREDTGGTSAGSAYIYTSENYLYVDGSIQVLGAIISFTGQHICFPCGNIEQGLVVSSNQNKYMNLNGKLTTGLNAITSSESLPIVSLSNIAYDKSVFGVVHDVEAIGSTTRTNEYTKGPKELGDNRVIVNSIGEGALWVVNTNGPLIAGDYITTSNIVGYGQKQDGDTIKNYTVAKITMNCDFNPPDHPIQIIKKDENGINVLDEYGRLQWEDTEKMEKMYSLRYLTIDGAQTDQANVVWTAAYVGCTYHCG